MAIDKVMEGVFAIHAAKASPQHVPPKPPRARTVTSVAEFVSAVMESKITSVIAFRGQKSAGWQGLPGIFRPPGRLIEQEDNMVRELISVHPQEFLQDQTMFDKLVRMQHFGLPTRLLDVTLNPLVALFFAAQDHEESVPGKPGKRPTAGRVLCYLVPEERKAFFDSDIVSHLANLANLSIAHKRAIEAGLEENAVVMDGAAELQRLVAIERPGLPDGPLDKRIFNRPLFVRPKNNNRRIIAQSGAFIVWGFKKAAITVRSIRPISIDVPADSKGDIRRQLQRLGIDASVLFPELDKAADIIAARYRYGTLDVDDLF